MQVSIVGSPESGSGRRYDLKDYAKSTHNGLLADVFDNRLEQTLGGCTIGVVRDTVSTPENFREKIRRAEQNDLAAHVAGDTLAVVPRFRALTAGTVRAGLLVNPHKNVQENLPSFALNMGEGVMLNNVGKMMMPGSKTQAVIASQFKSKIGREIATHLTVGAGFGGVKTGFELKNWTDENGNFAPGKLGSKMVQGMGTGALINVPAGMVGMRVMRGSISMMGGESQIASNRLAMGLAGAGSGYTSGAVFGGIDAVAHGKSFEKTLEQMHFSGKVGAFTGGFLGATDNGSMHRRYKELAKLLAETEQPPAVKPQHEEPVLSKDAPKPLRKDQQAHASDTRKDRRIFDDELVYETEDKPRTKSSEQAAMDYQPLDSYKLRDISPRLKNYTTETMTVRVLKKDAKTKFDSFEDYLAQTEEKQVKVRVYEVEGHSAKLVVEEGLAVKQDAARQERAALELASERNIPFDSLPADVRAKISLAVTPTEIQAALQKHLPSAAAQESLPVLLARKQMVYSNAMRMPLPEDFVVLMDGVPNRAKMSRVVLSESPNPQDPWWRQEYKKPKFASGASAGRDGEITFYLTKQHSQSRSTLRTLMGHEFGHLVDNNCALIEVLYPLAALVDKDVPNPNYRSKSSLIASEPPPQPTEGPMSADRKQCKYFAREYATKNHREDFAVHEGENVMAPDSTRLVVLGENAPVRTILLARSLAKTLSEVVPGQESPQHNELKQRLAWIEKEVLPDALRTLENRLRYGNAAEQAAAAELLGHFGSKTRHTPMLRKVASNPLSDVVPPSAPEATSLPYLADGKKPGLQLAPETQTAGGTDLKPRTLADIAFDAMLRLHEGNVNDQLLLLSAEANRNSPTRSLADNRLGRALEVDTGPYRRFAELRGDAKNLAELIKILGEMKDASSQLEVYRECYRLAGGDRAKLKAVVSAGLEKDATRREAIDHVPPEHAADYKRTLEGLAKQQWDLPLQEKARVLLDGKPDPVVEAVKLIRGDADDVARGVGMLETGKVRDMRVVEPLLVAYATGPEAARGAVRQALSKYSMQTLKFYASALKHRGIEIKPAELVGIIESHK